MASKYFGVPFALSGDKTPIPDASQPSGVVSMTDGYGPDYELDQVTEPTAKDVDRQVDNQLRFLITELLKELQENGLPLYDDRYNYFAGARAIGSDGVLYHALQTNGPATTVSDPVGDFSGVWVAERSDVRDYSATFDYAFASFVKGSDGLLYAALFQNGPSFSVVDPVGDTSGTWTTYKTDLASYMSTFNYATHNYAKGTDGNLYRAALINGPNTTIVNPVGDLTGTWVNLTPPIYATSMVQTVITASGSFIPTVGAKSLEVTVTGGGGGGAGAGAVANAGGTCGGGGGSVVHVFQSPLAASYPVTVGAGGAGGAGGAADGGVGVSSSFGVLSATGGEGGQPVAPSGRLRGVAGGVGSGGDLALRGGWSSSKAAGSDAFSLSGGSYWGGGLPGELVDAAGIDAGASSWGVGGGASGGLVFQTVLLGGDGGSGVVVVKEYF